MATVRPTDLTLSLEQLEGSAWGEADPTDTIMVQRIYALRKKPLGSLSDDEVRLAISQRVGAPFIIEVALQRLEPDPLLDADLYPGDLLSALVRAKEDVWAERPDLRPRLAALYAYAMAQPPKISESFRESLGLPTSDAPPN